MSDKIHPRIETKENIITLSPSLPPLSIRITLMYPSAAVMVMIASSEKPIFGSWCLSMPTKNKARIVSTSLRSTGINDKSQDIANLLAKRFSRPYYVSLSFDIEWTEELLERLLNACIRLMNEHIATESL
ncbi:hypothetical protein PCANB_002528 [Pneumocystis canis]|nr:hypothetical protein PCK1_002449 [Pneumocystis canis]KAG5438808.1 hypothetical protein PCANB_002528 [Pneumocystis canis]